MDQAETTSQHLQDIECAFCRSGLDDPRFLPCHDFFCMKCIRTLSQNSPFECPCCRSQIHLSESELGKLPVAVAFKRIRERLSKTLSNGSTRFPPRPQRGFNCEDHDIPLKLFCVDCDSPICPECALSPRHASHRYDYVVKADGTYWESVAEKELDQLKEDIRGAFESLEKRRKAYLDQGIGLTTQLNDTFDEMVAELERRRDEMLEGLSAAMQEGLHSFSEQEEALKAVGTDIDGLEADQQSASQVLREVNHRHLAAKVAKARERYARAVSISLPDEVRVSFQEEDCIKEVRHICRLKMRLTLNPAPVGAGCESQPATHESSIPSSLMAEAKVNVSAANESKSPVPTLSSPKAERDKPSAAVLRGYTLRTITGVGKPHAIAINSEAGQIVLTEAHPQNTAKICDHAGNVLTKMKGRKLGNPTGIAVDGDGCVFVSERDAHCVTKFDAEGKLLKTTRGSKGVKLSHPRGIELVNERLYVCDGGNNQVKILDRELNFVDSFSAFVSPSPAHVCASPHGLVYITSASTPGIQVFTNDHKFIHTIASSISGPICFDKSRDVLYVVDSDRSSVCQMRPDGTPLGKYQLKEDELSNCSGIAVDHNGRVYVCTDDRILELTLQSL